MHFGADEGVCGHECVCDRELGWLGAVAFDLGSDFCYAAVDGAADAVPFFLEAAG